MNIIEFLRARLDEDEAAASRVGPVAYYRYEDPPGKRTATTRRGTFEFKDAGSMSHAESDLWEHAIRHTPQRVLREVEAKRAILDLHANWPVLVEGPTQIETANSDSINEFAMHASRRFAWTTEREYTRKFGTQPPTAPMVKALAAVYSDHPDYDPEWA